MPVHPEKYMAPEHVPVFLRAARLYQVWILLRSMNPESRRYMGLPGYAPKRLDCKAKTAKRDQPAAAAPGGVYRLAGLVASPEIHGPAFDGNAMKYWQQFLPSVYIPRPGDDRVYLPAGMLYSIETDPSHQHYGCVYFTKFGLRTKKLFVYGDYDLYGLISARDPSVHLFVEEERQGQKHSRTPEFFDVQHYLNRHIGIPMILHGAQESYSSHTDEDIIVFAPDGVSVSEAKGQAGIEELYRREFGGRLAHSAGTPATPWRGSWQKV